MAKDMTQGSMVKTLTAFSVPLILSGLLQQLYSWADAFIVGNLEGEAALAAIGATGSITSLFIMAITGFTSGISILSARMYGAGERERQNKLLSSFLLLLGVISLVISGMGVLFSQGMLELLSTPAEILGMARDYLRIVLLGVPVLTIYNVYAAVLRGIGDSKAPFLAVVVSSVANIVLDVLFVGVLGWGVNGAAIATVISQVMMTAFIALYAIRKYAMLRIQPAQGMVDRALVKNGCALALPITVQSVISASGNLVLQNFMNSFGTPTVAAITTAYRIDSMILLPVINLGTGISTVTSQNVGAGNIRRARKCLIVGSAMMTVVATALTAFVLALGGELIELFGVTAESALIGRAFFDAIARFYVVFGLSMAIRGFLEGQGDVIFSGVGGIAMLAVRIVLSYALAPIWGNVVIAYAEAFAWCFQLALYVLRLWMKRKPFALCES